MKIFPSEWVIAVSTGNSHPDELSTFSPQRIRVRAEDESAGPFLIIRGENDEPDTELGENGHEFHLGTHEEIDEFAALLHKMLRAAEGQDEREASR